MEKTFNPKDIEERISKKWEEAGAFCAGRAGFENAEPFTIVIPPPNVTGSLHMGHALNNTLQDILCRYWRMKGRDVLWQPGTDHAGIATQMVVERKLASNGKPGRRELGREKFLEEVWAWKEQSGGTIINQLKRLGASCDWSRERFTMDEGLSKAVTEFFITLNDTKDENGASLLYKDKRLVNWDPKLLTAISDLEVEMREVKGNFSWARGELDKEGNIKSFDSNALNKILTREPGGHLYYIDYPINGEDYHPENPATFISVATTRPETLLGDVAVAVHPTNEKLKHLIGKNVVLPLVGRLIPIIGDEYADPTKGTGAVKITPAHDFNDFEVAKRAEPKLPVINILTTEGKVTLLNLNTFVNEDIVKKLPEQLHGLDRFEARKSVIAMLEADGLLRKIEPTVQQVPHGDRSNVPIEPLLTDQWYVNVKPLAQRAMSWVRDGKVKILPANREADFFRWLENIEPWCISRQLWWGHQIPAWYGVKKGTSAALKLNILKYIESNSIEKFVARSQSEAIVAAKAYAGDNFEIVVIDKWTDALDVTNQQYAIWRDQDVLDTWFSSALWPFSTLGWPEKTKELAKYYPTSVLITGFDILFFWVARMMMAAAATQKDKPEDKQIPFHSVYLHGLVRDEKGHKMSKTLGNVIDPLSVIDTLGADALRFTLASLAAQGRDPKLGVKTAEGYRNFCTKLWNASRFAQMNGCVRKRDFFPEQLKYPLNRWILAEFDKALAAIELGIESFRFNDAAMAAYKFTWNMFCDWYLELAKPVLQGDDSIEKQEIQTVAAFILDNIVAILHPFMPFITEELFDIYSQTAGEEKRTLCLEEWPKQTGIVAGEAGLEINNLVAIISEIRSVRAEMNVPSSSQIPIIFVGLTEEKRFNMQANEGILKRLARVSGIKFSDNSPPQSIQIIVEDMLVCLPLEGIIDLDAERNRMRMELDKLIKEEAGLVQRLENKEFISRAPIDVVEENRVRIKEINDRAARLLEVINSL